MSFVKNLMSKNDSSKKQNNNPKDSFAYIADFGQNSICLR